MPTLCIAVHDEMLAAALAVPKIRRPLNPEEVLQTRALRYQRGNAPYPAWYLCCRRKGVAGLVDGYARQASVFTPRKFINCRCNGRLSDVQFCNFPGLYSHKFKSRGIKIFGYLPEEFASKAFLAAALEIMAASISCRCSVHMGKTAVRTCRPANSRSGLLSLPMVPPAIIVMAPLYGMAKSRFRGKPALTVGSPGTRKTS